MLNTKLISLFIALFSFSANGQPFSQEQLLDSSENYYNQFYNFSISVIGRTKSSISLDTSYAITNFYISNSLKTFLYKIEGARGIVGMMIEDGTWYNLDFTKKTYTSIRENAKKTYLFNDYIKEYPFIDNKGFFKEMSKQNFMLFTTDSSFILTSLTKKYEFNKSNYRLQRIITQRYEAMTKGFFYNEIIFNNCIENDDIVNEQVEQAKKITSFKENTEKKREKTKVPSYFDRTILENDTLKILNHTNESFTGKTIFLDFFFQGCYPCVLAYPKVEELHKNKTTDFAVIGIDTKLSDTLYLTEYLKKYNINYPVIAGKIAEVIGKKLNIEVWPTFVVIAPDGKILEYRQGLSNSLFNRVKNKYLK